MTKKFNEETEGGRILAEEHKKAEKKINKKKENNMKNIKNNSTFKTVMHVFLTLLTLAGIAGIFYAGFTYGQKYENGINAHIQSQVQAKVLSATAQAPASK